MNEQQITDLLYQALETEIGGQQVYKTAIRCAVNDEAREEWEKYLEETENHERILREVFEQLELDPEMETPGRQVVRHNGQSLVKAMELAMRAGKREAAELVAAECIVLAETKDHQNWELIGVVSKKLRGEAKQVLKEAFDEVEDQEDEHLYHTMGWSRELWYQALGLPAQIPPPEEARKVKTAIAAARARAGRSNPGGNGRTSSRGGSRAGTRSKTSSRSANGRKSTGARGRTAAAARGGSRSRSSTTGRSTSRSRTTGRSRTTASRGRSTATRGRSTANRGRSTSTRGRSRASSRR
jgi:rubrerythrin